jgi:transcriptional regulator with XRE-family HTH domain
MEPDSNQAVGRRIVALRERAKLQQQVLAKQLHMAKSTLNGYESGERPLTVESLRRLRLRFGVTTDWLLFGDMRVTGSDLMLELGPEPGAEVPKKVRNLRK